MENFCLCCGEIIPEGRQVCWACEHGYDVTENRIASENLTEQIVCETIQND